MKIVVCVKHAVDVSEFVEVDAAGTDIDEAFKEPDLNEADTYALEAALRLRDDAGDGEVVVLTAGAEASEDALRKALAMGADRALRVDVPSEAGHDPVRVARGLAAAVQREDPRLVLCGVQSSDAAQQSTGPALAEVLGLPCVSVVTRIEQAGDYALQASREFEGGLSETVETPLPAVLTVQTGLNEPRYGSFKATMRARKAEIGLAEASLGEPGATVRRMFVPTDSGDRKVEIIEGSAADIAARIVSMVREAS